MDTVSESCQQCCQPLEEWEAGICEGCGTVDRKIGEVMAAVSEFLCDRGQWSNACAFLQEKGISPKTIADAFNAASKAAGNTDRLDVRDCE
jgi:hypothetical protein